MESFTKHRAGIKPRVLLVDLHELPAPRQTLDEIKFVCRPNESLC
jgi:hypothetical protein